MKLELRDSKVLSLCAVAEHHYHLVNVPDHSDASACQVIHLCVSVLTRCPVPSTHCVSGSVSISINSQLDTVSKHFPEQPLLSNCPHQVGL